MLTFMYKRTMNTSQIPSFQMFTKFFMQTKKLTAYTISLK
ncbi:hypothetical protein BTJ48_03908 [Bacillus mycoides]|nr:hypothetical protein BTJ48_03908 [Bacillus mycoides]